MYGDVTIKIDFVGEFNSQMEFVVESNYGVTMTYGDLLLSTNSIHSRIRVGCIMRETDGLLNITAVSKGAITVDLDIEDGAIIYDSTIMSTTQHLRNAGSTIGVWYNIPQPLWHVIYKFMHGHVY